MKNLENVQGDERDVIFVSVGYGPRVAGARLDSTAFGPVSAEGGERRLNVLITRARSRCEIFVSFAAGDIDLERARGEGPRVLKRFLQYAKSGDLEERVSTSETPTRLLRRPSPPSWRASATKSTSRLGPPALRSTLPSAILSSRGATCSRSNATERLITAVCGHASATGCARKFSKTWAGGFSASGQPTGSTAAARSHRSSGSRLRPRLRQARRRDSQSHQARGSPTTPVNRPRQRPKQMYLICACPPTNWRKAYRSPLNAEPHQVTVAVMAQITQAIVAIEGPVHQDEVARRVTTLFGKSRTGALISAAALRSLQTLKASRALVERDDFWMTPAQLNDPPVRDRSAAPLTLQRADMLSPLEIRAAMKIAERENGAMSEVDAAIAVTRLLGFKRTGPDLKAAILKTIRT